MTSTRRTATALAGLVAGAALLLTGCGHGSTAPAAGPTPAVSGTGDAQLKDMQQKVDSAESAAAQADSDATQNN